MKTALLTTARLEEGSRFDRHGQFVDYYRRRMPHWEIITLDNNSSARRCFDFSQEHPGSKIISMPVYHTRRDAGVVRFPNNHDYLYWWRAIWFIQFLFVGYDRIVMMDDRFFALSDRLLSFLDQHQGPWTTFWCHMFRFPEARCHVMLKHDESYLAFLQDKPDYSFHNDGDQPLENILPYHINRGMVGDRYGETTPPTYLADLDLSAIDYNAHVMPEDDYSSIGRTLDQ